MFNNDTMMYVGIMDDSNANSLEKYISLDNQVGFGNTGTHSKYTNECKEQGCSHVKIAYLAINDPIFIDALGT